MLSGTSLGLPNTKRVSLLSYTYYSLLVALGLVWRTVVETQD